MLQMGKLNTIIFKNIYKLIIRYLFYNIICIYYKLYIKLIFLIIN